MLRHRSDAGLFTSFLGAIIFVVALIIALIRSAVSGDSSSGEWHWDANYNNPLYIDCPMCGAKAWNYCRTKSGAESYRPHAARLRAFAEVLRQREKDQRQQ
jgi:hypothetical protein